MNSASIFAGLALSGWALAAHGAASQAAEPATRATNAPPADVVGLVDSVRGTCTVTAVDGTAEPAIAGRQLYSNEQLQCASGGTMTVRIGCRVRTLAAAPDPTRVAWTRGTGECDERLLAEVLQDYGQRGGRERGTGGIVYSPADLHAAAVSLLVLRWQPQPAKKLRFELRQRRTNAAGRREDAVLWRSGEVDGARGELESAELRKALAAVQQARTGEPLLLVTMGAGSQEQYTRFRVLDAEEERELRGDLESIAKLGSDPLVRLVGRAAIFKRYSLYPEAAREYDAALRIAPQSAKVRERAAEAHALAGNTPRVRELGGTP